jgi:transcriptional regulator with XRE-family HTH domain
LPFCHLRKTAQILPSGYPTELVSLGDHLRATRLDRRLTQAQAAEELEVVEMTVVNWELGHTGPNLSAIPRLIAWLGYDPRPAGDTLAEQIRWVRQSRGLSREAFAASLGVDPTSVARWESGQSQPIRRYRELLEELIDAMKETVLDRAA